MFFGSFSVESGDKWYWFTMGVAALLVIIQNFTFSIYYGMYTRLYTNHIGTPKTGNYSQVATICSLVAEQCPADSETVKGL